MNPTIYFSIISAFYAVLLLIMLVLTKKFDKVNKKVLIIMTIVNLGTLLCEAIGIFLGNSYSKYPTLNGIFLRLMLVLYIMWFSFFILFTSNVSKSDKKVIHWPVYLLMTIGIILTIALPLEYVTNKDGVIIYSTGLATEIVKYFNIICNSICLILMFKNMKKIRITNYSSIFALIITSTLAGIVQTYYPSILIVSSAETFVGYVMYYTIVKNYAAKNGVVNND